MKWLKILIILAILGAFYYMFMLIRMGKGLDIFIIGFTIFLLIAVFSYYHYVRDKYLT